MIPRTPWLVLATIALCAGPAAGEPVDLGDARARRVLVRFEVSPSDRPGQLDSVYTAPFPGWLEPGERPGQVRVRVDGGVVERHLLSDYAPVPGSFSDFVWVFDAESGRVVSATVSGRVVRHLRLGFTSIPVEAEIAARMDTGTRAGFRPPATVLGERVRRFCAGEGPDCTLVAPRRYDPFTGYVRAVGSIIAKSTLVRFRTFSPLGEAVFDEAEGERALVQSAAR